jgi:hypothetical protein
MRHIVVVVLMVACLGAGVAGTLINCTGGQLTRRAWGVVAKQVPAATNQALATAREEEEQK